MKTTKSISALLQEWADQMDVAPKTSAQHKRVAKYFFQWVEANGMDPRHPNKKQAINWKQELFNTKRDHTVAGYIVSTRLFFNYLENVGIYQNIFKNIKTPVIHNKYNSSRLSLSSEQLNQLMKQPKRETVKGARDYAIMLLMVTCALRVIEINRIMINDMYEINGKWFIKVRGKGEHNKQSIQIAEEVYQAIQAYFELKKDINYHQPMFASLSNNSQGKALSPNWINKDIKEYMRSIGLTDQHYSSHSLRHTAAVIALKNQLNIEEIRIFLRHRHVNTTQIYLSSISDEIRGNNSAADCIMEELRGK